MSFRRLLVAFSAVLAFSLGAETASAQDAAGPDVPSAQALATVTKGGIDDYILGAMDRLVASTQKFQATIGAYCKAPTQAGAKGLSERFKDLLVAWGGVDFLAFGPLSRENRVDRFAFWPDPHGTAERQMRQWLADADRSILDPAVFAQQSAALQGLPALERVLFDGSKSLSMTAAPDAYRCDVGKAIAGNLVSIATSARDEWQGDQGWRALMLSPGPNNPVYVKPDEPVVDLMKALLNGLERMGDQRIQPARGPAPEFAKASRAPYAMSGATVAYWRSSAEALARFQNALKLRAMIPGNAAGLISGADTEFQKLGVALTAVGDNLDKSLVDPAPRAKLGDALTSIQALRSFFTIQFEAASGLTMGFNALDGD